MSWKWCDFHGEYRMNGDCPRCFIQGKYDYRIPRQETYKTTLKRAINKFIKEGKRSWIKSGSSK